MQSAQPRIRRTQKLAYTAAQKRRAKPGRFYYFIICILEIVSAFVLAANSLAAEHSACPQRQAVTPSNVRRIAQKREKSQKQSVLLAANWCELVRAELTRSGTSSDSRRTSSSSSRPKKERRKSKTKKSTTTESTNRKSTPNVDSSTRSKTAKSSKMKSKTCDELGAMAKYTKNAATREANVFPSIGRKIRKKLRRSDRPLPALVYRFTAELLEHENALNSTHQMLNMLRAPLPLLGALLTLHDCGVQQRRAQIQNFIPFTPNDVISASVVLRGLAEMKAADDDHSFFLARLFVGERHTEFSNLSIFGMEMTLGKEAIGCIFADEYLDWVQTSTCQQMKPLRNLSPEEANFACAVSVNAQWDSSAELLAEVYQPFLVGAHRRESHRMIALKTPAAIFSTAFYDAWAFPLTATHMPESAACSLVIVRPNAAHCIAQFASDITAEDLEHIFENLSAARPQESFNVLLPCIQLFDHSNVLKVWMANKVIVGRSLLPPVRTIEHFARLRIDSDGVTYRPHVEEEFGVVIPTSDPQHFAERRNYHAAYSLRLDTPFLVFVVRKDLGGITTPLLAGVYGGSARVRLSETQRPAPAEYRLIKPRAPCRSASDCIRQVTDSIWFTMMVVPTFITGFYNGFWLCSTNVRAQALRRSWQAPLRLSSGGSGPLPIDRTPATTPIHSEPS